MGNAVRWSMKQLKSSEEQRTQCHQSCRCAVVVLVWPFSLAAPHKTCPGVGIGIKWLCFPVKYQF